MHWGNELPIVNNILTEDLLRKHWSMLCLCEDGIKLLCKQLYLKHICSNSRNQRKYSFLYFVICSIKQIFINMKVRKIRKITH